MRYNVRGKFFSDGSAQFLHMPGIFDTVHSKKKKKITGEHAERGKKGNLKTTIQEIYDIAKSNKFDWFFTLTFNPDVVNSFDYGEVCKYMARFTDVLRKRGCLYVFVPELHKSGRYHFHGLVIGDVPMSEAIDPYTGQKMLDNQGRIIYNVDIYKYGFSTATKIFDSDKAASYLTKYLSKELGAAVPKGKKRYWASKSLARPEKEYYKMTDEDFGGIFTGSRFRKTIQTDFGRFDLCEY